MSVDEIIDELDSVSDKSELQDNANSTPGKEVSIPEQKGEYALSFYEVLAEIDEATVYHRDDYDNGTPDTDDDIVGLHNKYQNENYQPAIALGPVQGSPGKTTIYLVGKSGESSPVDLVGDVASKEVLESGNADYVQFPVYNSMDDVPDLDFGQAVAVAGDTNDLFFQTE